MAALILGTKLLSLFSSRKFKKPVGSAVFGLYKFRKIIKFLKLKKPLVIFSLETTGPSVSADKIIEIAYMKIMLNGRVKKGEVFLNPQIDISEESVAIHGITKKDLKDKPTFRKKANEIWDIFNNCYYGGFNIVNFDLPLLRREFIRVGMRFEYTEADIIDSKTIFNYMEPPTLSVAYNHYCHKDYLDVHRPRADVQAEVEILEKQLEKYEEVRDWEFINQIHSLHDDKLTEHKRKFYWRAGKAYFIFSKHRDKPLSEVVKTDPKFLRWILKANFSEETKNIVRKALEKKK